MLNRLTGGLRLKTSPGLFLTAATLSIAARTGVTGTHLPQTENLFTQIFSSSPKGVCVLLTVFCGVPKREKGSFPSLLLKSSHPSGIGSRIFQRKMLPRHPEGMALRATSFSVLVECRAWTRTRAAILRVAAVKKTSRGLVFRRSPPVRRFSNVTPLVAGARCEQAHTSTAAQSCTSPDTVGTPSPKHHFLHSGSRGRHRDAFASNRNLFTRNFAAARWRGSFFRRKKREPAPRMRG